MSTPEYCTVWRALRRDKHFEPFTATGCDRNGGTRSTWESEDSIAIDQGFSGLRRTSLMDLLFYGRHATGGRTASALLAWKGEERKGSKTSVSTVAHARSDGVPTIPSGRNGPLIRGPDSDPVPDSLHRRRTVVDFSAQKVTTPSENRSRLFGTKGDHIVY